MNVFFRELKAHWKALMWWSIAMSITVVSGMAKFEGYSTTPGAHSPITQLLQTWPKPVLAVFGISGLDISKLIGYVGVMYLYIVLIAAMHAGLLGAEVITKEERDKTSEFLFPKPVSRARVLSEKLGAAVVNILILWAVTVGSTIWITGYYNKGYGLNHQVMLMMYGVLLFQLVSFAFGAFFAGTFKNPKLPAAAISTVIMTSYLAVVFVDISPHLNFLQYVTPFSYFSAAKILADGALDPFYVWLTILISILLFVLTYIFYDRRDLSV